MTRLLCHWEKCHTKEKWRPISYDKNTNLGKICVTMTDLRVEFYEKIEESDVICEECSKLSGKTSKANFEKNNHY